jgi:hypothetical protein
MNNRWLTGINWISPPDIKTAALFMLLHKLNIRSAFKLEVGSAFWYAPEGCCYVYDGINLVKLTSSQ